LVIIELTGNLHFEGVMLFFFYLESLFICINGGAADDLALSIATNLLPLLLCLCFSKLGWKKSFAFLRNHNRNKYFAFVPFFLLN
jgi:hypothetical protein